VRFPPATRQTEPSLVTAPLLDPTCGSGGVRFPPRDPADGAVTITAPLLDPTDEKESETCAMW